jgi:hypothetical protein
MSELWNRLHDATLVSVNFDWATGSTVIALRTGLPEAPSVAIMAEGTTILRFARKLPWGESVSINEVRGPAAHENGSRLEIEMQSGDVLELEALSMKCTSASAT